MKQPDKPSHPNQGGPGGNAGRPVQSFVSLPVAQAASRLTVVNQPAQAHVVNLSARREYVDPYLFQSGFYESPAEYEELHKNAEQNIKLRAEVEFAKPARRRRSK